MTIVSSFATLNLAQPIQRALVEKNYTQPSPIQAQAIPHLLEGRDLMGCAQTGTGKTAAFALPILDRLSARPKARTPGKPRALILTPTRELASQIGENFAAYGKHLDLRHTVIFGGVGQNPQVRALAAGVEIVVATPGRLLDLHSQGKIDFGQVEIFVLDEADRMLDMGFAPDVKRVMAKLPARRQSLLFSATMPAPIMEIANKLLRDPVKVEVAPVSSTAERIAQHVCHVEKTNKTNLLVHTLSNHPKGLVLVFSRTKHGSNKLVKQLGIHGIRSEAIHGNKSQTARERALEQFREGKIRVLVATDIAARGIDVKGISLVINYDIPNEPESYVHRIGRTARAGADGMAIAFCEPEERAYLRDIEKLIRTSVPVLEDHPFAIRAGEGGRLSSGRPQGTRSGGPGGAGSRGPSRARNGAAGQRRPSSGGRGTSARSSEQRGASASAEPSRTSDAPARSRRGRGRGNPSASSGEFTPRARPSREASAAEKPAKEGGFWSRFGF
jgi:ATP-dependent RNA helicase RhlE